MTEFVVLPAGTELTIEDAIRLAAAAFDAHELTFGHGTDDAVSEASWLVQFALGRSPLDAPDYRQVLSASEIEQCNKVLLRRIRERLPAAYITGTTWFAGLPFRADQRALVPRSPLAEFIVGDFFGLVDVSGIKRVLDLCTGGGCIAIACAAVLPHALVDASDLSADALALAALNVADHQLQDRVRLIQCGLFDEVDGPYELIISNPPYVDQSDIDAMGAEFSHEPLMGLAAGEDGLDLVREMLFFAPEYLSDNGLLVVEVGNSAAAVERVYPNVPFEWLEFVSGGTGVFIVDRPTLLQHRDELKAAREKSPL